ncbi:MAG TPA: hypothetical protein VF988_16285 [Verrucomicrobiae bacterium]
MKRLIWFTSIACVVALTQPAHAITRSSSTTGLTLTASSSNSKLSTTPTTADSTTSTSTSSTTPTASGVNSGTLSPIFSRNIGGNLGLGGKNFNPSTISPNFSHGTGSRPIVNRPPVTTPTVRVPDETATAGLLGIGLLTTAWVKRKLAVQ